MSRQKSGSIITKNNKIYARLRFIDELGKKRDLWRIASSKVEAKKKLRQLIKDSETKTAGEMDAVRMTFSQLASFYETNYLQTPVYIGERKISGLRQSGQANQQLKILKEHFGSRFIQTISYSDVLQYKLKRLNTPTRLSSKQRSVATVNRELQRLRRLFSIAVTQGWLSKSVFKNGDALINAADEIHRSRILSFAEEMRLLNAIDSEPRRFHLKGIVLIALDCAFRKNEILTLCRKDIDLKNKTITIRAFNTKTAKTRTVGMTSRVYEWLVEYSEKIKTDDRLFPITSFKTAWGKVLKKAQIEDFHFHDCRASAISRLISAGLPHTEVMRISGHSTLSCLFRYIRTDDSTIFRAVNALDAYLASNSISNEI